MGVVKRKDIEQEHFKPMFNKPEAYEKFYERITGWLDKYGQIVSTDVGNFKNIEDVPKVPAEEYIRSFRHILSNNLGEDWMIGNRADALIAYHFKLKPRIQVRWNKRNKAYMLYDADKGKFRTKHKWEHMPYLRLERVKGKSKYAVRDTRTGWFVAWVESPYELHVEVSRAKLEVNK